ncbi:MAG TPA: YsnF/AvaK domain-containing protein [Azospirillum sp.]
MTEEWRVPLHEEVLSVGKRSVESGRVRIATEVHEREQTVEQDLDSEDIDIVRVPVGRPVDAVPDTRQEGDVLIVPVVEEELVVTKRLVLKEELHIRKRTTRRTERVTATLRSEEAVVTRDAAAPGSPEPSQE